jgi:hypothetical protein
MRRVPDIRHGRSCVRRGFTLIEAALATMIVGLGVVAMLQLLTVGTMANLEGGKVVTGLNLARNVREFSLPLKFKSPTNPTGWGVDGGESLSNPKGWDDIDDLAGVTFDPPIDGAGNQMTNYPGWKQKVTVQTVDPDNVRLATTNGSQPAIRLTVTAELNGVDVCSISWFVFDGSPGP